MWRNVEVAILTKLNELAERYGLRPSDFVATIRSAADSATPILQFELPAHGNALREDRFAKMLLSLGVDEDGRLRAPDSQIIDALDAALAQAPRSRRGF